MALRRSLGAICVTIVAIETCAFLTSASLNNCETPATAHSKITKSSFRGQTEALEEACGLGALRDGGGVATDFSCRLGVRMARSDDLYIVGAGYLGTLIGREWRAKFPSATVYAETRSTDKHHTLAQEGFTPVLRSSRFDGMRCPSVVFCAAPSGNDDYAAEVTAATTDVWDSTGVFMFTSSGGIYAEKNGGTVNEESSVSDGPRAEKLRGAEAACIGAGGTVVRLAGLYSVERGPHNFWLGKDELDSSPDGLVNLLAYEDAASVVVTALAVGLKPSDDVELPVSQATQQRDIRGRVFLAADDVALSRRDICEHALRHPHYTGRTAPRFNQQAPAAIATKYYDTTVTRRDLGWTPQYRSFADFMEAKAADARQGGH